MEIRVPERLSKLKFHFLVGVALSLLIFSPFYLSPKVVDVVTFFGPLFLSTALFLASILVFARTLPPAGEPPGEKAAEVILDLVTGQPIEVQVQPIEQEKEDLVLIGKKQTEEEQKEEVLIGKKQTEEEEEKEQVVIGKKQAEEEVQAGGAESVESEQKM